MNDYLLAAILGIVEGLTEFLPVSSTAHIRLAQQVLYGHLDDNFWKLFSIAIQLPAVLAVVVYFWPTLWRLAKSFFERDLGFRDYAKHPVTLVAIAFVFTAGPAVAAKKLINGNLESLKVMGGALLIGGVVMAVVDTVYGRRERRLLSDAQAAVAADQPVDPAVPAAVFDYVRPPAKLPIVTRIEDIAPWKAAWIGLVEVLAAVFPGTSRSMCTIAAGQITNLTRAAALEFSFFLSIPIMFAAFGKDMKDSLTPGDPNYVNGGVTPHEYYLLMIGSVASFLVALMVIAWFMAWVRRRGFLPFAVYRVIIGSVVLFAAYRSTHPA